MSRKYEKPCQVPGAVLAQRLRELVAVIKHDRSISNSELTMRVPAECDRDFDIVMTEAAKRLSQQKNGFISAVIGFAVDEDAGEHAVPFKAELPFQVGELDGATRERLRAELTGIYRNISGRGTPAVGFSDECPDCGWHKGHRFGCPADNLGVTHEKTAQ